MTGDHREQSALNLLEDPNRMPFSSHSFQVPAVITGELEVKGIRDFNIFLCITEEKAIIQFTAQCVGIILLLIGDGKALFAIFFVSNTRLYFNPHGLTLNFRTSKKGSQVLDIP
jgi:hypothetical protein